MRFDKATGYESDDVTLIVDVQDNRTVTVCEVYDDRYMALLKSAPAMLAALREAADFIRLFHGDEIESLLIVDAIQEAEDA